MIDLDKIKYTTEQEIIEQDRLPDGQRLVYNWPILDLGIKPNISFGEYRLIVNGEVDREVILTTDDILSLQQRIVIADWHCVTTWSKFDNRWSGVYMRDILELSKPKGKFITFTSYDGYTTNIPLDLAYEDDSLIVYAHNNILLSIDNGGPFRGVVSKRYAWKSAKWIHKITVTQEDIKGFWEVRGYHNNADYRFEERYS